MTTPRRTFRSVVRLRTLAVMLGLAVVAGLVVQPVGADQLSDKRAEATKIAARLSELDASMMEVNARFEAANFKLHQAEAAVAEAKRMATITKAEMEKRANKLTPLPFLLMACARALKEHPRFNSSLAPDGTQLVLKKYIHIGIAVDTPQGLVVPVIRDVDRKTVWELAAEARELADKARTRKLKPAEMQGGCFSISSLGNMGGEGFTPIVNTPEVAILGVSRMAVRPVWVAVIRPSRHQRCRCRRLPHLVGGGAG